MFGQYNVSSASELMMLGVGQPSPQILSDSSQFIQSKILDTEVLQYGFKQGFESYRQLINKLYKDRIDFDMPINNIYMTNGISQSIFMMASLLKNKGYETVYVEDLTYFIMINVFKDLGFKIKVFDLDTTDMFDINSIIYIIPFCNNPTGKSLNINQIENFIDRLPSESIVFSDETYHFLQYNYNGIPPLANFSQQIISFGTFSKILCPGVRLGWLYSHIKIDNLPLTVFLDNTGFMDSGGSVNPVMAYNVVNGINKYYDEYNIILDNIINDLENKNNFIQNEFLKYPEYFEFIKPEGGYFLLVKSKKIDSDKLLQIAKECNITFHQANKFSILKSHSNEFRISVSFYSYDDFVKYFPERLKKIVEKIVEKISRSEISLYGNGKLGKLILNELQNTNYNYNIIDRNLENIGNIVIDVTSPEGTIKLIDKCTELYSKSQIKTSIIIGTTGHDSTQMDKIKEYSKFAPVIYCSNFSDGIQNLIKMIKNLDFNVKSIDITDIHHIHKKDAPSGTAKLLKKELEKIYNIDINISSIREGEVVGYHKITLNGINETIEIIHNANDRNIFAKGALKIIEKIKTLDNGFY
jgi:DNA-binding transcriptional MocR family regulator